MINLERLAKVFATLCLVTFCSHSGLAQFRKYSNEFLNIGVGARGLAMGGAQAASASDVYAGYWNPAGLSSVREAPQIAAMHAEYFSGIGKFDYLAAALPTRDERRTIGITALRFGVDDIPNTLFLVEPDGSLNYGNISSFSSADYAFLFSLGQKIKDEEDRGLAFGASAKVIHRSVGKFAKAWGFGFDAGLQYRTGQWRFGAMARDITTTYNTWSFTFTEEEKEKLYASRNDIPLRSSEMTPPRLALGASREFRLGERSSLLAELNADLTFDGQRNTLISNSAVSVDPRFGLEGRINDVVYLRAGINNFQRALADEDTVNQKRVWIYQPSAGAGVRLQGVTIDYAFVNLANQESPLYTHVVSLQLNLNRRKDR